MGELCLPLYVYVYVYVYVSFLLKVHLYTFVCIRHYRQENGFLRLLACYPTLKAVNMGHPYKCIHLQAYVLQALLSISLYMMILAIL